MNSILFFIFFLSGAAGLVYETIWPRYIKLFVGHGADAQIIVLVVFLGGMALGALAVGKFTQRIRQPLVAYAAIEFAVGLCGLFFHPVYTHLIDFSYDSLLAYTPGVFSIAKWTLSCLLILPQSIMLGTTFPLMSAAVIRRRGVTRVGDSLSMLYFSNSLGAALGCLVAGFLLIEWSGLPGTTMSAGMINIVVAAIAVLVAKSPGFTPATTEPGPASPAVGQHLPVPQTSQENTLIFVMLILSFGTAVASFIYEISWIRMLSLVLGSSTHVFELMLSAFILGIALGGLFIRRRIDGLKNPIATLAVVQWAMGLCALATLPLYLASFDLTVTLMNMFETNDVGYLGFTVSRYFLCLSIMLPSTFCAGMTLPLITKILFGTRSSERAIGQVYGVNTFGSIVGVAVGAVCLMPLMGLKPLMILGGCLDMGLGILLIAVFLRQARSHLLLAGGLSSGSLLLVLGLSVSAPFDPLLMSSGTFRTGTVPAIANREMLFHRDGRTATISVHSEENGGLYLSSNGKVDSSISATWLAAKTGRRVLSHPVAPSFDEPTQTLLAMIPLAHAPHAQHAAVIGCGLGMTSHFLLGSPYLEHLETVEIERAVSDAARTIYPVNARLFDDPRSQLIIEDAKAYFAAHRKRYDLVVSEPSNPWVSGVAGLFSVEFYQRMAVHLKPQAVFGQWLQLYELNDDLALTVIKALSEVFPNYRMYQIGPADVVILASLENHLDDVDWSVFSWPDIRQDLSLFHSYTPDFLNQFLWFTQRDLASLIERVPAANSDFFPVLELGAERARYLRRGVSGLLQYRAESFDLFAVLNDRPLDFLPETSTHPFFVGRYAAQQRAARMRRVFSGENARFNRKMPTLSHGLYATAQFRDLVSTNQAPLNWPQWVLQAVKIHRNLHDGSSGAVFEPFFSACQAYLARQDAPPAVQRVLDLLRSVSSRDFPTASSAAEDLLAERRKGQEWLPDYWLGECGAAVCLQAGQPQKAKAFLQLLRKDVDFRFVFLAARIADAQP